jgi:hypothetical protein
MLLRLDRATPLPILESMPQDSLCFNVYPLLFRQPAGRSDGLAHLLQVGAAAIAVLQTIRVFPRWSASNLVSYNCWIEITQPDKFVIRERIPAE